MAASHTVDDFLDNLFIFSPRFSVDMERVCEEQLLYSRRPEEDMKYVGFIQGLHGLMRLCGDGDITEYCTSSEKVFVEFREKGQIYFCLRRKGEDGHGIERDGLCRFIECLEVVYAETVEKGSRVAFVDGIHSLMNVISKEAFSPERLLYGAPVTSINSLALIEALTLLDAYKFALFYDQNLVISNASEHLESLLSLHQFLDLPHNTRYNFTPTTGRCVDIISMYKQETVKTVPRLRLYFFVKKESKSSTSDSMTSSVTSEIEPKGDFFISKSDLIPDQSLLELFHNATESFLEHLSSTSHQELSLYYTNKLTPYKKVLTSDESVSGDSKWLHDVLNKKDRGFFLSRRTISKKEHQFYYGETVLGRSVAVGQILLSSCPKEAEIKLADQCQYLVGSIL